ncbi:MAG: Fic family protein [Patescibacteria group bacterium]
MSKSEDMFNLYNQNSHIKPYYQSNADGLKSLYYDPSLKDTDSIGELLGEKTEPELNSELSGQVFDSKIFLNDFSKLNVAKQEIISIFSAFILEPDIHRRLSIPKVKFPSPIESSKSPELIRAFFKQNGVTIEVASRFLEYFNIQPETVYQQRNLLELLNRAKIIGDMMRYWRETNWPSAMVIRQLHESLMQDSEDYSNKGVLGLVPGQLRAEDVKAEGHEDNFYAKGTDVSPLMRVFSDELDNTLENLPDLNSNSAEVRKVIKEAAKAYYVFERIHPFLDGNGRIGRLILQRVLSSANLKHLIFDNVDFYISDRSKHLEAMEGVDRNGTLLSLELFITESLLGQYIRNVQDSDGSIIEEMFKAQIEMKEEIQLSSGPVGIESIWLPFQEVEIK